MSSNQNEFKCNICPRSFKTKAALQQHKKDSHGTVTPGPSRGRNSSTSFRRPYRGRGRGGRSGGLSLNPTTIPPTMGGTITVTGEDRVLDFKVTAYTGAVQTILIDSTMSPRLQTLTRAYQRIRFNSVMMNVTCQVSAMTNGGYVAGFVMDPDDARVKVEHLQSSQGSVVSKWYESKNVFMPKDNKLYYTSSGIEPRTRSPGRFWLMSDSTINVTAAVVITARWSVTLSHPTYEEDAEDYSFFLEGKFTAHKGNYDLYFTPVGGSASEDTSKAYPQAVQDLTSNAFFAVNSFNIEYSEGTGDTGTIQAHFLVYNPTDKRTYYSADGTKIITTQWQGDVEEQVAVPCGAYLRHHKSCSGNSTKAGLQIRPLMSQDSTDSLKPLLNRLDSLEKSLRNLKVGSMKSSNESLVELLEKDS